MSKTLANFRVVQMSSLAPPTGFWALSLPRRRPQTSLRGSQIFWTTLRNAVLLLIRRHDGRQRRGLFWGLTHFHLFFALRNSDCCRLPYWCKFHAVLASVLALYGYQAVPMQFGDARWSLPGLTLGWSQGVAWWI